MARLDLKYGQAQWVDVHPGDLIPNASGTDFIVVNENMIHPDGTLKHSSSFSTSTETKPIEK